MPCSPLYAQNMGSVVRRNVEFSAILGLFVAPKSGFTSSSTNVTMHPQTTRIGQRRFSNLDVFGSPSLSSPQISSKKRCSKKGFKVDGAWSLTF